MQWRTMDLPGIEPVGCVYKTLPPNLAGPYLTRKPAESAARKLGAALFGRFVIDRGGLLGKMKNEPVFVRQYMAHSLSRAARVLKMSNAWIGGGGPRTLNFPI